MNSIIALQGTSAFLNPNMIIILLMFVVIYFFYDSTSVQTAKGAT